jgi:hypothetical protein
MKRLLADLADAPEHDIVDRRGIDAGARHHGIEDRGSQISRVPSGKAAAPPAARGADRG